MNLDDAIGWAGGILGGSVYMLYAGITWENAWESLGSIIWVAFVAMLTGGAGKLGSHLVTKYLNRKKKK